MDQIELCTDTEHLKKGTNELNPLAIHALYRAYMNYNSKLNMNINWGHDFTMYKKVNKKWTTYFQSNVYQD